MIEPKRNESIFNGSSYCACLRKDKILQFALLFLFIFVLSWRQLRTVQDTRFVLKIIKENNSAPIHPAGAAEQKKDVDHVNSTRTTNSTFVKNNVIQNEPLNVIENSSIFNFSADTERDQVTDKEPSIWSTDFASSEKHRNESLNDVINYHGVQEMNTFMQGFFKGVNLFCEKINNARAEHTPQSPLILNISFGCSDMYHKSALGTGNVLSALYSVRLASKVYNGVNIRMGCPDAEEQKKDLILPWLTGWFPSDINQNESRPSITIQEACEGYKSCPIAHLHDEIAYDLRRMAIALVGVPSTDHPSAQFAKEELWSESALKKNDYALQIPNPINNGSPLYEGVELDDTVLHFRCGDLANSNHPSFGFMRFSSFTKYISPDTPSIGIITQPFEKYNKVQTRGGDAGRGKMEKCRILVTDFVDYLQERFPQSRVRVHNGPGETIALAYARIVMAKHVVIAISSFGVFPAIATFGTSYIRKPDFKKAPNQWLLKPNIQQLRENVVLINEPDRLMAQSFKKLWQTQGEQGVLSWFRYQPPNP